LTYLFHIFAYVTARGHTLIDRELYLPLDWTEDRDRCQAAGIDIRRFASRRNRNWRDACWRVFGMPRSRLLGWWQTRSMAAIWTCVTGWKPPAPSPLPARPDRPRSAPSACTAHLALFFICLSGSGLVVVASPPSKSCQLLPHEMSSEGWLILASSPFSTDICCPSFSLPDFQEISWKCRSSREFPATAVSLVCRFVSTRKETRS